MLHWVILLLCGFVPLEMYLQSIFLEVGLWVRSKWIHNICSIARLLSGMVVRLAFHQQCMKVPVSPVVSWSKECVIPFHFHQSDEWEVVSWYCSNLHFSNYEWKDPLFMGYICMCVCMYMYKNTQVYKQIHICLFVVYLTWDPSYLIWCETCTPQLPTGRVKS